MSDTEKDQARSSEEVHVVQSDEEKSNGESEETQGEDFEEDGEVFEKKMSDLKKSLDQVNVHEIQPVEEVLDPANFPPSYKENTKQEEKAIRICKTFIKQYIFLLTKRRPLFIIPKNEFDIKKVVCTTIKPFQLPFKDLLDWPEIAEFLAGYMNYDKLQDPVNIPEKTCAPQTVLERLHGHCFEYSTLLCSMLIGAGYDAFVVSGYATREVANLDLTYTMCPFVEGDKKVFLPPKEMKINRYTTRGPRLFASEYVLRMKKKKISAEKEIEDAKREIEEKEKELREAPPEDAIYGWRVHSWVMVLKGLRQVAETFFIEPTTGLHHPTDWEGYLGIESLWNHKNYYVNVQKDKMEGGVGDLNYDIGDSRHWEYMFAGQDLHLTLTYQEEEEKRLNDHLILEEIPFALPESWCLPLKISRDDFDRKYPTGKRTRKYKNAIVDDYCRYLNADGLVRKIFVYTDLQWKELAYTREIFEDRSDLLQSRFTHQATGKVIDVFLEGREDFLREHHYRFEARKPQVKNVFFFEPGKRADELYKREEDTSYLKCHYMNRDDKMTFFSALFGPKGIAIEKYTNTESRLIEELIEKSDRNPSIPIKDDKAEIHYIIWCDEINIIYQVLEGYISRSTRRLIKPTDWYDDSSLLIWCPDLHENFETDPFAKSKTELEQYQMLLELMDREAKLRAQVRSTERETVDLLKYRDGEEKGLTLLRDYNQADRDEELRKIRKYQKAQEKAARILAKSDILKDYLEPYIMALNLEKVSNRKQAQKVKDNCMQALKTRLVLQANLIKSHYDQELEIIGKAQSWYHTNFFMLSKHDLADFRIFKIQHMFIAHILERRLSSLKVSALIKYHALHDRLIRDKRLEPYLI